jgi:hypothetical protein
MRTEISGIFNDSSSMKKILMELRENVVTVCAIGREFMQ